MEKDGGTNRINEYDDYRLFLKDRFLVVKRERPVYSYQYCARKLGLTRSYLAHLFALKRHITIDRISKFAEVFRLSRGEKEYFTFLFLKNTTLDSDMSAYFDDVLSTLKCRWKSDLMVPAELSQDRPPISHWLEMALLSLVRLSNFQEDLEWISLKLKTKASTSEIRESIERLLSFGFLQRTEQGKLTASGAYRRFDESSGDRLKDIRSGDRLKAGLLQSWEAIHRMEKHRPAIFQMYCIAATQEEQDRIFEKYMALNEELVKVDTSGSPGEKLFFVSNNIFSITS